MATTSLNVNARLLAIGFALVSAAAHAQTAAPLATSPLSAAAPFSATVTAPVAAAAPVSALNPAYQRYTAAAAQADLKRFASVQTALLAQNAQQTLSNDFVWVKAQRWLDVAQDEYRNNNCGAVPQQALGEAMRLMPHSTNASNAAPTLAQAWDTPLLASAPQIRADLWSRINAYEPKLLDRAHPLHAAAQCSGGAVAYTQVQLAWAAWVNASYGWRSALPYIAHAEKMLEKADAQFSACKVVQVIAAPAIILPPAPVAVPIEAAIVAPIVAIAPPPTSAACHSCATCHSCTTCNASAFTCNCTRTSSNHFA